LSEKFRVDHGIVRADHEWTVHLFRINCGGRQAILSKKVP
jgi:hypothetical protein